MLNDGSIVFLGNDGNVYKRDTSGNYANVGKLNNGAYGVSYRTDVDKVFFTSTTTVSEYSPISNEPVIDVDKYGPSKSTDSNASASGGTQTFTLKTAG